MRKCLLLVAWLICNVVLAQNPHGPVMSGGQSNGVLFGRISDSSGRALPGASVLLLKMKFDAASQTNKGILFKGAASRSNGDFSIEDIPLNQPFQLKISATGYKTYTEFISLKPGEVLKDLGKLKLNYDSKQLQDVTVRTTQPLLKADIDKLSFQVEKNMITTGGTALDVMRYVPSLQVDIDGNVKLRNAVPQLFIDGRPTNLTLEQIPADAIESVEVITNPSARYDASGGNAGIINLVLKKNRKTGYNANLRFGIDKRAAINGGADLNLRQGKINFSLAFNGMQFKNFTTGSTSQFNAFIIPHQQVKQEVSGKAYGGVVFGKAGLDYFLTNRTAFSANIIRAFWKFEPKDETYSEIKAAGIKTFALRRALTKRDFNPTGWQLGMKHIFPKEGRELTADATFFSGRNSFNSSFVTDSINGSNQLYATEQQSVLGSGNYNLVTLQTDFITPVGKNARIETGLRASLKKLDNNNETFINSNSAGFIKVPNGGSNYKNTDNVYAAYVQYAANLNSISYQVGLRAESSDYTGIILSTGEQFSNRYPTSLFPSVFLSKKLAGNQQLQLSYSRRINRPSFFNLIPFIDRTDPLNYSRGNPELQPEFTNSINASYIKTYKASNTLLLSAYYKLTNNLITRFQEKSFDAVAGKEVLINTYINAEKSFNYGAEITSVTAPKKWWDLTLNLNAYNSSINTGNAQTETAQPIWSWFGKVNHNFKLPNNFTMQLSANYQSKTNIPVNMGTGGHFAQAITAAQGYIKPFYGVDFSVRKNFLKNNTAFVSLGISDIFRSRWQHQHSENAYFIQDYSRLRDPQMIRLNIGYRFGKADASLFKRKNMKVEGESFQGATQGVGQ